jgi:hypothetical protein
MVKDKKYNMSFTTGSLYHYESVTIVELYIELQDWNAARNKAITENLLQSRTLSTLKKVCGEVISRLKTLSPRELNYLAQTNHQEQAYLLWIAVCRRYEFIADFATEVLRERYITLKSDLSYEDFDAFFNQKAEWHEELERITQSTRSKSRQVLFRILREANLLSDNNIIHAAMLSSELLVLLREECANDIFYFPIFEADMKKVK